MCFHSYFLTSYPTHTSLQAISPSTVLPSLKYQDFQAIEIDLPSIAQQSNNSPNLGLQPCSNIEQTNRIILVIVISCLY
nr:hypothetical protein Q903MT_gene1102 [Picea sitchensis]